MTGGPAAGPADQDAGRVALVTGASRGLGAAIARRLAADGHAVAVNHRGGADGHGHRGTEAADRTVEEIETAGGTAVRVQADATDEGQVAALVAEVTDRLGPVDVLVVNATGPQPPTPLDSLDWPALLDQLHFFVKSPALLLREVAPGMRERRRGRVVQIGSDLVDRALPEMSAYAAAKAAQHALTRAWARELGPWGITVNTVAPGWIPVERHADAAAEELECYAAEVPLRRTGVPAEVADAVAFLASDRASFVTGQRLVVNGGHTLA